MRATRAILITTAIVAAGLVAAPPASATTAVDATVQQVVVDNPDDHGKLTVTSYLNTSGKLIPAPASAAALPSGTHVKATMRGRTAVAVTPTLGKRAVTTQTLLGAHTLKVLPVTWPGVWPSWAKRADLVDMATKAAQYWAEQSGGQLTITTDVRDWKSISSSVQATCDYTSMYNQALAAHGVTGPTSRTEHVLIFFPNINECSWAGLGDLNGSRMWDNGMVWEDIVTHEFGHNLGLGHSGSLVCSSGTIRVPLSSSCRLNEYGDAADVMGGATWMPSGTLTSGMADALGLAKVATVTSAPTTVTLSPLTALDGVRAIRIPMADGTRLYIDYRPAVGRDTRKPEWAGVQVHQMLASSLPTSRILDMQPNPERPLRAANLPAGATWNVPGTTVAVKVLTTTPGGATLTVIPADGSAVTQPIGDVTPPVFAGITTSSTTTSRTAFGISWNPATDPESPKITYTLHVNGSPFAAGPWGTSNPIPLQEGRNTFDLRLVVTNNSGLQTTAAKTITLTRDTIAPAAPTGLALTSDWKTLSWIAPNDTGSPLTYWVYVDGRCIGGTNGTSYGIASAFPAGLRAGAHKFQVIAYDLMQFRSPFSPALWVSTDYPITFTK